MQRVIDERAQAPAGPGRAAERRRAGRGDDRRARSPGDAGAQALTFAPCLAPVKKVGPLVPIGGDFDLGGEGGWMAR